MTPRVAGLGLVIALVAGCTLFTPLDDLSQPPSELASADASAPTSKDEDDDDPSTLTPDAGAARTDASTAPDGGSAPGDCPCPAGTEETNGVCVFAAGGSAGYTCNNAIVAPVCARTYEARLCAQNTKFPYDSACSGTSRQSVFFSFGKLPPRSDGEIPMWLVDSSGTEVIARTNAACTVGTEPCAAGPAPGGELAAGGAVVAWGKNVTSGCTTVRINVRPK